MPILSERGYLIPALDNESTDYVRCAQQLAHSIRQFEPEAKIAVVTLRRCADSVFDYVIPLPHGDQSTGDNKQCNDWQMFQASPFRQTIKLEADMIIASSIDHWWEMMQHREVCISTGCRDYYDQAAQSRFYRKLFDTNNLPDVYNAVTYWRVSNTAKEFFKLVRDIFEHWADYRRLLKFADEEASTDVVYAMAAQIIGVEQCTMPFASYPKIVHMKKHIVNTRTDNWTRELVWETNPLRIQTVAQWGAFHYHIKDWQP